jgi:TldD protein
VLVAEELLGRVLKELSRGGADFAEIFAQRCAFTHITLEDRTKISANQGFFVGAGLRILSEGFQRFACVPSLEEAALLKAARELSDSAGKAARRHFRGFKPSVPRNPLLPAESPSDLPLAERADLLCSAQEAAFALDGRVCAYSAIYKDSSSDVLVANSEGVLASETRAGTTLYQQVTVREGSNRRTGAQVLTTELASDLSVTRSHLEDAREAARSALVQLEAGSSPSGEFPVLFAPGAAGPLLHEAVGHALEGDFVLAGRSPYAGRVGQRVSGSFLTLGDGGWAPGRRAPEYDDEGTPVARAILVEEGVLRGFLTDRASALGLGCSLTGHARRESYRFPPMPRMRSLFVEPGPSDPEELLRPVEFGLYVVRTSGGPVETPRGAFEVDVTRGYIVREGRLAEPISGAKLSGTGPALLESIDGVADNPAPSAGSCLKAGQVVSVSESVPAIRVSKMAVRGD